MEVLKELVAYAKKNPGKLNFANTGPWGAADFPCAWWAGPPASSTATSRTTAAGRRCWPSSGGHADATSGSSPSSRLRSRPARSGCSPTRHQADPHSRTSPPSRRRGTTSTFTMWRSVLAPKGIPQPVAEKLETAFKKLSEDRSFQALIKSLGDEIHFQGAKEFEATWREESEQLPKVVAGPRSKPLRRDDGPGATWSRRRRSCSSPASRRWSGRSPFGAVRNPGPGFLPWWVAVTLGILSLLRARPRPGGPAGCRRSGRASRLLASSASSPSRGVLRAASSWWATRSPPSPWCCSCCGSGASPVAGGARRRGCWRRSARTCSSRSGSPSRCPGRASGPLGAAWTSWGAWRGIRGCATPINLLYCFLGALVGTAIGVLPASAPRPRSRCSAGDLRHAARLRPSSCSPASSTARCTAAPRPRSCSTSPARPRRS